MKDTGMAPEPFIDGRLADMVFRKRGGKVQRIPTGLREAAREAGVVPATLSRVERGYAPDLKTFISLCKWLGASADDLLGINTFSTATNAPTESPAAQNGQSAGQDSADTDGSGAH